MSTIVSIFNRITMNLMMKQIIVFSSIRTGESEYFSGNCVDPNGRYAIASQCDAYVQCKDGAANETLCSDGLLFDDEAAPEQFPCKYPIEVECKARGALQPAQPTEQCPHQFGYFRLGDPANCRTYLNCANGIATVVKCPLGLAFDETSYICDWPDNVLNCDAEAYLGFRCPSGSDQQFYKTNNCKHYFSCPNGKPRLNACPSGFAFSEELAQCTEIQNVAGCDYALKNENEDEPQFRIDIRGN